jgi:hypothetical protein
VKIMEEESCKIRIEVGVQAGERSGRLKNDGGGEGD